MVIFKTPPGTRRVLTRHKGATGVVVYARYNLMRGWPTSPGWDAIGVRIDREKKARDILRQLRRGPIWLGLDPGRHRIAFLGAFNPPEVRSFDVDLTEGEVILIDFVPIGTWPFYRPDQPVWNIRSVRPGRSR